MWMMIMVEELRIFGDFRVLDDKIEKLPNTMEGLLVHILDRLIQEDDENGVVKKVLCLIACSRHGLPSDNILKICGNIDSKEELAPMYWARARRTLKQYLRAFGRSEEIIIFSHDSVLKAVRSHLLATQSEVVKYHTMLADYYQFWCNDLRKKVYYVPYHLEHGRLKKRLVAFMREDRDSYWHINPWMRSSMLKNVRCRMLADSGMPSTVPLRLCNMCSMRSGGYNPACTWQNKQCCVLCGSQCVGSKTIGARACTQHAFKHGLRKCVLCTFMTSDSNIQAQLCTNCGFAQGERLCACFDV
uniref:Uncharacterized protein n=1 Tax=Arion vulgaris TaxID=1028688 RepID=A0A0B7A7Z1_9EUPU